MKAPWLNDGLALDLDLSLSKDLMRELTAGLDKKLQELTYSGNGDIGDIFAPCIDPRQNADDAINPDPPFRRVDTLKVPASLCPKWASHMYRRGTCPWMTVQ